MITEKTLTLLGAAIYSVQKFEYGLYGLASHYTHLQEAQNDRRFRDLDPEKFLRGDLSELRATLGQIARTFGNNFYLEGEFLDSFLEKRNIIVHRLWRLNNDRRDEAPFDDLDVYLQEFVDECEHWNKMLRGIYSLVAEGAAIKEGREAEFIRTEQDAECIRLFETFIGVQKLREMVRNAATTVDA